MYLTFPSLPSSHPFFTFLSFPTFCSTPLSFFFFFSYCISSCQPPTFLPFFFSTPAFPSPPSPFFCSVLFIFFPNVTLLLFFFFHFTISSVCSLCHPLHPSPPPFHTSVTLLPSLSFSLSFTALPFLPPPLLFDPTYSSVCYISFFTLCPSSFSFLSFLFYILSLPPFSPASILFSVSPFLLCPFLFFLLLS